MCLLNNIGYFQVKLLYSIVYAGYVLNGRVKALSDISKSTLSSRESRSRLSEFVREYRLEKGLTQIELERALGIAGPHYVSKVETGRIASPSRKFVKSMAEQTGRSEQELRSLSREPLQQNTQSLDQNGVSSAPFRLAFGHCLWGAPVFLAAHRGMIPEFSVASYSLQKPEDQAESTPAWIQPEVYDMEVPGPGAECARAWSAVKVLDLVEKEIVHIGVVPGNVIWGRGINQRFMRLGSIVDSTTGCTFICDSSKFSINARVLSTRELFNHISKYVLKNNTSVRIAVEVGTVADIYLQKIFEHASESHSAENDSKERADLSKTLLPENMRWHCESGELAHASFNELKKRCFAETGSELLGVISWEPHVNWLETSQSAEASLKKFPLHFSPNGQGQISHMSFDLVTLRTAHFNHELRSALIKLMQKLWQNATLLSELDGTGFDTDPVRRVAKYFGFSDIETNDIALNMRDAEKVRSAVQGIRYSVHWAMENQSSIGMLES